MTVAVLIISFSFLLLIGVPIAWCMGVASLITIYVGGLHLPTAWFAQQTLRGADVITLAAIPLFLFAGELMNRGGLTTRIMRVAEHAFGRITGGLGLVNVATALVYGGISGSATADTGAVGSIMIPAMAQRGYPKAFAAAVTAASGTLGIIGPQSVVLILYGVLTNTSIGGLLVAALVPGAFIAATFMITSYIVARRHNFPRNEVPAVWGEIGRDVIGAMPALLMPVLVLGSIIGGIATATEASALAVVYSFLVGILVYRELPLSSLYAAASAAVATTGVIMMIMALATPFGWILTVEQVPATAAAWITGLDTGPIVTIILVLVLLKVVGFWLDLGPALIILAPILVPIALAAGMTPYQTGIVFTMTLGIGLFTPPIGTNIFVVCNVAKLDMWSVSVWLVPYWIASVICVAGLVAFPSLTEWLRSYLEFEKMQHLVCGISSAGRVVPELDGEGFFVDKAQGPYVWDHMGRRYIDTALGFGATFLGHTDPVVTEAVRIAMERGSMPAYAHTLEEEAAQSLAVHTRDLNRVIFLNSGSEAIHLACRTARKVTGRTKIVKAAAGYDGWFDDVAFGNAGSPEGLMATNARPQNGDTLLTRFNDSADADLLFSECNDVAAVVLEPMLANAGCVVAKPGYLEHIVALARRHGALVIMDEVLMGFRLHPGLASHYLGISPDLATVGKAIGNGYAVAALIGRPDIMSAFDDKRVTHAGTYNGNPVACAAVHASMSVIDTVDYEALCRAGDTLRENIRLSFQKAGAEVSTSGYGTVFTIWRAANAPSDYSEAVQIADPAFVGNMHMALRRNGIMSMFSTYGRHYISARSDEALMQEMIEGFARAAQSLAL